MEEVKCICLWWLLRLRNNGILWVSSQWSYACNSSRSGLCWVFQVQRLLMGHGAATAWELHPGTAVCAVWGCPLQRHTPGSGPVFDSTRCSIHCHHLCLPARVLVALLKPTSSHQSAFCWHRFLRTPEASWEVRWNRRWIWGHVNIALLQHLPICF